jgi:hypothetical protein
VGGCGRLWEAVGGCGRLWEAVLVVRTAPAATSIGVQQSPAASCLLDKIKYWKSLFCRVLPPSREKSE